MVDVPQVVYEKTTRTFTCSFIGYYITTAVGDRCSTVVKVLCHKSEGRWFDPSWCQWILH